MALTILFFEFYSDTHAHIFFISFVVKHGEKIWVISVIGCLKNNKIIQITLKLGHNELGC